MDFLFPQNLDEFHKVKDLSHLQSLIRNENTLLVSKIQYRSAIKKQKYLYAKCKYRNCRSFMNFTLSQDHFALARFDNHHSHTQQGTKIALYKQIEQEINDMPITMKMITARHIICQKYRIPASIFYYLFKKVKNQKITYLQLTDLLNQQKYQVQSDPFYYGMNELPDLMVIISPQMKENFLLYGDWMGFDFTYNIVQGVNEAGRQWRVGIFTGISASKKIVPFGLVLCNQQTKQRYVQILKSFSDIMTRYPKVIISDQDKAFISAIDILRQKREFDGIHLLDTFHILRNIKKNLVNKELWTFFNQMIRERSQDKFQQLKQQCLQAISEEKDIATLQRFIMNSYQYCFSQVQPHLFGFMPNTTMNEKIHDMIKGVLPYSKPFTVVVKKILQYLQEVGQKCHQYQLDATKYQSLFQYSPLKEIRYTVCKSITKKIVGEIAKGLHHQPIKQSEQKYIIIDNKKPYVIKKRQQKWQCTCCFLPKTGIFCSHLAKVIISNRLRPLDYIVERWKLNVQQIALVKKRQQRQRKTRRNRK